MRIWLLLPLLFLMSAGRCGALETIYLIRHAEKEKAWPRDRELSRLQPLNAAGMERAARWAGFFRDLEGEEGLAAVYCSPTTRTMHTGLPIAEACGVELIASEATISADDMPTLLEELRTKYEDRRSILIVGHSNTVPLLLRALGLGAECDDALGISEKSYGPGIDGNGGLWAVDLAGSGCESARWTEDAASP